MILETTFIIDFLRGKEEALEKMRKLEEDDESVSTTSVSVF